MAAGLRAVLRGGVVTFIVLGAGAVFLILGIAGVSLRASCLEAGVCVDTADPIATGSIAAVSAETPAPVFAAPSEPPTRETRLKSAGGMIAATFDALQIEPDASIGAEETEVAALPGADTGPEAAPPVLAKRVVKSVEVTPEGQPVWASPAGAAAIAAVAEVPANAAVAVVDEAAGAETVPEIEPLAFSARASETAVAGAPIPQPRPAALTTEVAAVEPEPAVEPAATGDRRIVLGQGVNVRSGASSSSGKLFALKGGAEVTVSDKERGWLKVTDEEGRTGWVYSNYLKPAG